MSITRLMILGLVRWLQPVHGYDVRRELVSWNVEQWASIQPGSIYHALRKLTADGLLEEVATEQVGARPARTTYRLTASGEAEFGTLMREYWWGRHPTTDPFLAAFSFLPALPREEAVLAFRHRAGALRSEAHRLREFVADASAPSEHKPVFVGWMFEIGMERAEVEAAWCDRVADRIAAGEGIQAGEGEEEMTRGWRREMMAGSDSDPTSEDKFD